MELNTEINRVFGAEMAKVFAAQISEEELLNGAKKAYNGLMVQEKDYLSGITASRLEKLIQNYLIDRILEAVNEEFPKIFTSEKAEQEAEAIIAEATQKAHDIMVQKIADGIVFSALTPDVRGYALKEAASMVARAIENHR